MIKKISLIKIFYILLLLNINNLLFNNIFCIGLNHNIKIEKFNSLLEMLEEILKIIKSLPNDIILNSKDLSKDVKNILNTYLEISKLKNNTSSSLSEENIKNISNDLRITSENISDSIKNIKYLSEKANENKDPSFFEKAESAFKTAQISLNTFNDIIKNLHKTNKQIFIALIFVIISTYNILTNINNIFKKNFNKKEIALKYIFYFSFLIVAIKYL